jgi:hypothetical protein
MLTLALLVFDLPARTAVFSRRKGTVTVSHRIFGRGNDQVIRLGSIRRAFAAISGANPMPSGTTMSSGQKCPTLALRRGKPVPLSTIASFSASPDLAVRASNDWLGVRPARS